MFPCVEQVYTLLFCQENIVVQVSHESQSGQTSLSIHNQICPFIDLVTCINTFSGKRNTVS